MKPVICPTVTATDQSDYRRQIEEVQAFTNRLHIDFMDGIFAPTVSPPIKNAWWPHNMMVDFHVMYKNPLNYLEIIVSLQPHLIILHVEAEGIDHFLAETEGLGIKRGLALLKDTPIEKVLPYLGRIDHILFFSGSLGHFGGKADLNLLSKVREIKSRAIDIEIGWDGGIDDSNVKSLINSGVTVLNTGGYIHKDPEPEAAYDRLVAIVTEGK
jgi:ribulose-phosphate 3-epimerase